MTIKTKRRSNKHLLYSKRKDESLYVAKLTLTSNPRNALGLELVKIKQQEESFKDRVIVRIKQK